MASQNPQCWSIDGDDRRMIILFLLTQKACNEIARAFSIMLTGSGVSRRHFALQPKIGSSL